jgi:FKBP-type peptidyl-prolyl cis-trans isomerase 2
MAHAQQDSTVSVHYIGTLDNGRIFHSTADEEPLTFTIGRNQVFPALERAVIGMAVGETVNIVIPANEAYGPRLKENIIRVERTHFPAEKEIRVGQKLSIGFTGGTERVMQIAGITETEVTLDGNHPLAGQDLTFALRLDGVE